MAARFLGYVLVAATLLTPAAGCVAATGRLYVRTGPPPIVVERRAIAPGPDFVWQAGFYRWSGREYAWVPGHYVKAPRRHATWVPGRWAHDRRGWYFVEGHWR